MKTNAKKKQTNNTRQAVESKFRDSARGDGGGARHQIHRMPRSSPLPRLTNMAARRLFASNVRLARFAAGSPLGKSIPAASAFFSTSSSRSALKNVTIIGCGLMGSGIAQVRLRSWKFKTLIAINLYYTDL